MSNGGKGITIDIKKRNILKYILFADLYYPQGIINVLIPVLIPIYLVDRGISIEFATIVASIGWIPWIIKFAYTGVIDKHSKHGRKIFVIIGSLIAVCCFFILFFIDPTTSIIPFTIILFISQIGQSFHDSAADAWAIDICQENERGKINGAMVAGASIGGSSSAIILAFLAEKYGFNNIFLMSGFLILLILIIPLILQEIKKVKKQEKVTPLLIKEFSKKRTQLISLFALITVIGGGLFIFVVPQFAINVLKLSLSQIGIISATAPLVIIPGGLIGGAISDRWNRKKTIYAFAIPSIIIIFSIIFVKEFLILLVFYFARGFLASGKDAASNAMYMDVTNPKISATQFSMFNSITSLGIIGSGAFAGLLIAVTGYTGSFIFISLILIPPLFLLYFIKLNHQKN